MEAAREPTSSLVGEISTPSGAGFPTSVSDTIYVTDGEYGPWKSEVDVGSAGKYGVGIDANQHYGATDAQGRAAVTGS